MPYVRDGDVVTLTMTVDEFSGVLLALGVAAGDAAKERGAGSATVRAWFRLADAVNEGNPGWTPYNLAPERGNPTSPPAASASTPRPPTSSP